MGRVCAQLVGGTVVAAASENSPQTGVEPLTEGADTAVRRELDAVLASSPFRDAELLKRLLRYAVEQTWGMRGS